MTWQGEQASFKVKALLGQGTFGNVLELVNCETKEKLALKVIRPQLNCKNQGQHELRVLKMVQKYYPDESTLLQYNTAFYSNSVSQDGKMQTHLCLLFPKFEMTLTHLLRGGKTKGFTMTCVSYIAKQLCHALNCLRKIGLHHRDIKPDNIMVKKPPVNDMVEICLIDFGSATTHVEPSSKPYVQSRFYRAPEVMLGHTYTMDVDMWSFGCVLVEMLFAKPIYLGQNETEQLTLIHQFQGPFPRSIVEWGTSPLCSLFSGDYDVHTNEIMYKMISPPVKHYWSHNTLKDVCLKEKLPRDENFENTHVRLGFYNFVAGCLQIDYTKRWTPEQALGHPFLKYYQNNRLLDEFGGYIPPPRHKTVDRNFTSHRYARPNRPAPIYTSDIPRYSPSYSSESDGSPNFSDTQYFPTTYSPAPRHSPSTYNQRWVFPSSYVAKPQHEMSFNKYTPRRDLCHNPTWRHRDYPGHFEEDHISKPRSFSQDYFNPYVRGHCPSESGDKHMTELTFSRASFSHSRAQAFFG